MTSKHMACHVDKFDISPRAIAEEKYTNNFCQSVQKHCREKERKQNKNWEGKCKTLCVNTPTQ